MNPPWLVYGMISGIGVPHYNLVLQRHLFNHQLEATSLQKGSLYLLKRVTLKNQDTTWTVGFQFANCKELFVGCIPIVWPFSPVEFECLIWKTIILHDVASPMPQTIPLTNHLRFILHDSVSRGIANFIDPWLGSTCYRVYVTKTNSETRAREMSEFVINVNWI